MMRHAWQGSAEFIDHPTLGRCRMRLDRWWGPGPRALICMCNASSADGAKNDPTVGRCIELMPPDIDGFTVVNWEPHISAEPKQLYAWRDRSSREHWAEYIAIRDRNLALIRTLSETATVRFIAWGRLVPHVPLTTAVLKAMSLDGTHDLYAFGVTKDGEPKHPMARGRHRIPAGAQRVLWLPRRIAA